VLILVTEQFFLCLATSVKYAYHVVVTEELLEKSYVTTLGEFLMKQPSKRMTANEVQMIKNLLETRQYHQHQIAAIIGINQGRVSETKNGLYDHLLSCEGKQINLF